MNKDPKYWLLLMFFWTPIALTLFFFTASHVWINLTTSPFIPKTTRDKLIPSSVFGKPPAFNLIFSIMGVFLMLYGVLLMIYNMRGKGNTLTDYKAPFVLSSVVFLSMLMYSFQSTLELIKSTFVTPINSQEDQPHHIYDHKHWLYRLASVSYYYILTYARLLGLMLIVFLVVYILQQAFIIPVPTDLGEPSNGFFGKIEDLFRNMLIHIRKGVITQETTGRSNGVAQYFDNNIIFSFMLKDNLQFHASSFIVGWLFLIVYASVFILPLKRPTVCAVGDPKKRDLSLEANRVVHGFTLTGTMLAFVYLMMFLFKDKTDDKHKSALVIAIIIGMVLSIL